MKLIRFLALAPVYLIWNFLCQEPAPRDVVDWLMFMALEPLLLKQQSVAKFLFRETGIDQPQFNFVFGKTGGEKHAW